MFFHSTSSEIPKTLSTEDLQLNLNIGHLTHMSDSGMYLLKFKLPFHNFYTQTLNQSICVYSDLPPWIIYIIDDFQQNQIYK